MSINAAPFSKPAMGVGSFCFFLGFVMLEETPIALILMIIGGATVVAAKIYDVLWKLARAAETKAAQQQAAIQKQMRAPAVD